MKTKFTFILLALCNVALGQVEEIVPDGNYYFRNYTSTYSTDAKRFAPGAAGVSENYFTRNSGNQYKIKVMSVVGSTVNFRYWKITSNDALNTAINGANNDVMYSMNVNEFRAMMGVLYDRCEFRAGFFGVPYKLRFNDFDYEADITVGGNISCYIRWNRKKENGFALEPLFGIGLTKVNVDDSNSTVTEAGSQSAFTVNAGLLFHVTSKINVGVFYGVDSLSQKDYKNSGWEYNGNGWLGIGLNITFSETNTNKSDSGTQ